MPNLNIYLSKMSATNFNKFNLLLWKNYLLIINNPRETILELASPLVIIGLLVLVRIAIPNLAVADDSHKSFLGSSYSMKYLQIFVNKLL